MTKELTGLIQRAIQGDHPAMDQLVRQVQPRLRAYILRCTLDENLADDILQETMLQMLKSLKSIKNISYFWPWLYRIASNKIAGHFRKTSRRSTLPFSSLDNYQIDSILKDETGTVGKSPMLNELHAVVLSAVEKLNPVQRSVLSLRCFEDMPYGQIAEAVGCREAAARVHFFRARQILQSRLKKQGISGGAVVPALVLFGKITACEKTIATGITVSSVNFSSGLTTVQTVITAVKTGFLKYTLAAGTIAATIVLGYSIYEKTHPYPYPQRQEVESVHYTVQGIGLVDEKKLAAQMKPADRRSKGDIDVGPYTSKGAYEMWTQFPDGPDGPIFVRMQRWGLDPKTHENTDKLCGWLQNGRANYYYASGLNRVYITNDPIGMLILPTDPPELSEFLVKHAKYQDRVKCSYDRKTGLVIAKADSRVPSVGRYKTEYAYNGLSDADFERFWPEDAGVVDERDMMHRRGWTCFTVEGTYHDFAVTGRGRMPFTYSAYQEHKPWLHLIIGSETEIIDTPDGAVVIYDAQGHRSAYPAETFFNGLGRPWCGIRAFDTTCRDAAKEHIPFTYDRKDEAGTVVVQKVSETIQYQIDMLADLIKTITFFRTQDEVSGQLTFNYVQESEDLPESLDPPLLPQWASQEPVLRPDYGLFGLLENTTDSGTQFARQ